MQAHVREDVNDEEVGIVHVEFKTPDWIIYWVVMVMTEAIRAVIGQLVLTVLARIIRRVRRAH